MPTSQHRSIAASPRWPTTTSARRCKPTWTGMTPASTSACSCARGRCRSKTPRCAGTRPSHRSSPWRGCTSRARPSRTRARRAGRDAVVQPRPRQARAYAAGRHQPRAGGHLPAARPFATSATNAPTSPDHGSHPCRHRADQSPGLMKLLLGARTVRVRRQPGCGAWLLSAPRGDGHAVLVYPGGPPTSAPGRCAGCCGTLGHDAHGWGQGRNVGRGRQPAGAATHRGPAPQQRPQAQPGRLEPGRAVRA